MSKDDVYVELRRQIDKMPVGMPATESGVEIRILKHFFTPEEARIALQLNMFLEPVERIHSRLKQTGQAIALQELEKVLDRLVGKGSILSSEKDGKKLYSYSIFAVGMFESQVNRLSKEFYEDSEEYLTGEFGKEFFRTGIPQLRVVPVEKSITVEHHVATYDDMRALVKNTPGEFGVMNCICKQGKDLTGHSCQTTNVRETCILFPHARIATAHSQTPDTVRAVNQDEVLQLLQRAENEGLVIQPSNTQKPAFVCCCCGDCCGVLTAAKRFPKPAALFATNYHAEVNLQSCSGCGTCVKRCQMDAPVLANRKSSINLDRCIGCGLCVPTCPSKAIRLVKNEKNIVPPKNFGELYRKILTKKVGTMKALTMGVKKVTGQKV